MSDGHGVAGVRAQSPRDRDAALATAGVLAVVVLAHLADRADLPAQPERAARIATAAAPTVALATAAAMVVLTVGRWVLVRRLLAGRESLQLVPSEQFDASAETIEHFAAQLARTGPPGGRLLSAAGALRVQIATDPDGVVRYVLVAPRRARAAIQTALAAYDGVELRNAPQPWTAGDARGRVVRARLVLARSARQPLAQTGLAPDLLEGVAAAMAQLDVDAGEHASLTLDVRVFTTGQAQRVRRRLLRNATPAHGRPSAGGLRAGVRSGRLAASETVERRHDTRALDRKLDAGHTLMRFRLLLRVNASDRRRALAVMRALLGCLDALGAENHLRVAGLRVGGLGFLGADLPGRRRAFDRWLSGGWFSARRNDLVSAAEIQGLLKPPTVHCHAENVVRSTGPLPSAPRGLPDYHGQPDLIPLGTVRSRTTERMVGVRATDTVFSYMAGRSRYGKTETAIGQFVALARSGAGGLFLDPHADAIAEIKAYLTDPQLRDRVVEIDLSDHAGPARQPGWNLFALQQRAPDEAAGRVEAFVDALAAALGWDERNTRAQNLATQAAQALTELALILPAQLAPTIFEVPTLLSDQQWRAAALPHLSHATRGFFESRFPSLPGEAITAVTNLIDRLRASRPAAALLGSPVSTYDARRAMRQDLIVLACPGSGSTRDRVLANLLVYDVLHAFKARSSIAPAKRRAFWVFLDELQTYDGPNLPALLEQSAKYGGRAFLFNQNPERLTPATWNAVSTNRSHLLSTTVNAKAARMIAAEWGTPPAPEVLTRLDRYTYLASVTHATKVSRPFLVDGIAARELHAEHHHPGRVPDLDAAIEQTTAARPVTDTLAELDGHAQRIRHWLEHHPTTPPITAPASREPEGPHVIRLAPDPTR
jgi:hypothetical protein